MKLTEEQKKEVAELYRKGNTVTEICKIYNIHYNTAYTILSILNEPIKRKIDEKQIDEIKRLYASGVPSTEIAKIYCVSPPTILSRLQISGETTKHRTKINKQQQQEIVELYRSGKTSYEIAGKYFVTNTCILRILRLFNEKIRLRGGRTEISKHIEDEVIQLYQYGKSIRDIKEIHGIGYEAIRKILHSHEVQIRTKRQGKLSETQKLECVGLYRAGFNTNKIAKKYNTSHSVICVALHEFNVEVGIIKPKKEFYDTTLFKLGLGFILGVAVTK